MSLLQRVPTILYYFLNIIFTNAELCNKVKPSFPTLFVVIKTKFHIRKYAGFPKMKEVKKMLKKTTIEAVKKVAYLIEQFN